MNIISTMLTVVGFAIAAFVLFKIITAPVRIVFKLLINAVCGFFLLFVANIISGFFNVVIPMNFTSCLVSGIFGIPGVILVVVATLFF